MPPKVGTPVSDKSVDELDTKIKSLRQIPFLSGKLISKVILRDGNNDIGHGLGRPHQGWIITRQYRDTLTSPGRIREYAIDRQNDTLQLLSTGFGGSITVDIWCW
jgi:hypothetical protein